MNLYKGYYSRILENCETDKTNHALRTAGLGNKTEQRPCPFCEGETEHVALMRGDVGSIGHRAITGTLQDAFCCVQCDGGTKVC